MTHLYLDTETTGLDPQSCRILQLAARLHFGTQTLDLNTYIKPDGFDIPAAVVRIHGIDTYFATQNGIPLSEALDLFTTMLEISDVIVGHHVSFDVYFITEEAYRANRPTLAHAITSKPRICTKKMSADYLRTHGENNDRTATKLATMFHRFSREKLTGAHDAYTDVLACELVHRHIQAQ